MMLFLSFRNMHDAFPNASLGGAEVDGISEISICADLDDFCICDKANKLKFELDCSDFNCNLKQVLKTQFPL